MSGCVNNWPRGNGTYLHASVGWAAQSQSYPELLPECLRVTVSLFVLLHGTKACISLVKAAEQFLRTHGKRKGKCHVNLVSHCEINKHCQKVLEGTYGFSGACLFEDVTNLDTEKGTGYCVRHKTMCKLSPTKSSDPNCSLTVIIPLQCYFLNPLYPSMNWPPRLQGQHIWKQPQNVVKRVLVET